MIFSIFSFVQAVISSTASGISWSPESGLCIQIHGILAALAAFPPFVDLRSQYTRLPVRPAASLQRKMYPAPLWILHFISTCHDIEIFHQIQRFQCLCDYRFWRRRATARRYPASFRQQSICSTPGISGNPSRAIISSFFSFII